MGRSGRTGGRGISWLAFLAAAVLPCCCGPREIHVIGAGVAPDWLSLAADAGGRVTLFFDDPHWGRMYVLQDSGGRWLPSILSEKARGGSPMFAGPGGSFEGLCERFTPEIGDLEWSYVHGSTTGWTFEPILPATEEAPRMTLLPDGAPVFLLTLATSHEMVLLEKEAGAWSFATTPIDVVSTGGYGWPPFLGPGSVAAASDGGGRLHVLVRDASGALRYYLRDATGWAQAAALPPAPDERGSPLHLTVDDSGAPRFCAGATVGVLGPQGWRLDSLPIGGTDPAVCAGLGALPDGTPYWLAVTKEAVWFITQAAGQPPVVQPLSDLLDSNRVPFSYWNAVRTQPFLVTSPPLRIHTLRVRLSTVEGSPLTCSYDHAYVDYGVWENGRTTWIEVGG